MNFTIPNNPEFTETVRRLETTDSNHADVFNDVLDPLLLNTIYLKKELEAVKNALGDQVTFRVEGEKVYIDRKE